MTRLTTVGRTLTLVGAGIVVLGVTALQQAPATTVAARENAYRANNIGVSRLEQYDFQAAAASFRRALEADSTLAIARLNLGIALFYGGDPEGAERELAAARKALPDRAHPDYVIGLIARGAGRIEDALASFTRVQKMDPVDPGTAINLGQLYRQERKFPEAIAAFQQALAAQPFNATAAYGLANSLLLGGQADAGKTAMARFEQLSQSPSAVTYSQAYLEQGRYAEAITSTGAEVELVDTRTPDVTFSPATSMLPSNSSIAGITTSRVTLFDLDDDGDLDVADSSNARTRILRNDGGRLADVSGAVLGAAAGPSIGVLAGDFDNDTKTDLLLLRADGVRLLRRADSGFADVTAAASLGTGITMAQSAAWLDADHDGDLDLFLATRQDGAATRLFQNNGKSQFADITAASGLGVRPAISAVVPTDYDNRRDIDIVLVGADVPPMLFQNLRDGTFRNVASDVGLALDGAASMAVLGDVNKDGFIDVFFPRRGAPGVLALSDGRGRFVSSPGPAESADAIAAQFIDYDSDGLLDFFLLTTRGPRIVRNQGRTWVDVSARAIPDAMASALKGASSLATGDLNGDGRPDVVAQGPSGLTAWLNGGGPKRQNLTVRLTSRVSNRSALGAKIEMRAGSLKQQIERYSATPAPAPVDITFGLGDRAGADVVRVLWPSGILQAETGTESPTGSLAVLSGTLPIEELDRKPSSCPYLYTWNGERFEFITDFLGGGEMGYWLAPGLRNTPDPDEYVRIDGQRLQPKDGRYELRVTNELEEALFLDRAQLVAVAHPADVEVHPNEGLVAERRPLHIYTVQAPRPPLAARDHAGRDVLDRVSDIDRKFVDGFPLETVRGYAAEHTLALTLPPVEKHGRRLLLLTGWTDYAFSNDNVAAHQVGLTLQPPSLEFRGPDGTWRTAIADLGIPVGRPQTVVVDLTNRVPPTSNDVRIKTTMRVYWDRVLVDQSDGRAQYTVERLEAVSAQLGWRGFSAEVSPDGREPFSYDYARVSAQSPWKLMPGRYTREGDVRELLTRTDDMFVVSRPGDAIALSFDATTLAPLPRGWTRTFLLYTDGYSKEMNLHSSSPDALLPLPFHAMTQYPYRAPDAYPSTPAHREYLERYNTRVVPRAVPSIDGTLDRERR